MKQNQKENKIKLGTIELFTIVLSFFALSLVITKTIPALTLCLLLILLLKVQKVSWLNLYYFIRIPVAFAFIGLISIIIVLGTDSPNTIFIISKKYIPLSITIESLKSGEIVLWRAINALLSLYIIIGTTTITEKNALIKKLRIPNQLVELGILSFRYIQILNKKMKELKTAQQLRLGYSSYKKSFRSLSLLLSTVFIYSTYTFNMNYQALLTRGYTGTLYYSDYTDLPKDRWWLVAIVLLCVISIIVFYQIFL